MRITVTAALFLLGCMDAPSEVPPPEPVPTPDPVPAARAEPASAFAGRTATIAIVAADTNFDASTQLVVDDDITITSLVVESPTQLHAELAFDPLASLGARRLMLLTGSEHVDADFVLEAPIEITTRGTLAQGSLVEFEITNRDLSHPFERSIVVGPQGVRFEWTSVETDRIRGEMILDPTAISGLFSVLDHDGVESFTAPLAIARREPESVSHSGSIQTLDRTFQNARDTHLFRMPSDALQHLSVPPGLEVRVFQFDGTKLATQLNPEGTEHAWTQSFGNNLVLVHDRNHGAGAYTMHVDFPQTNPVFEGSFELDFGDTAATAESLPSFASLPGIVVVGQLPNELGVLDADVFTYLMPVEGRFFGRANLEVNFETFLNPELTEKLAPNRVLPVLTKIYIRITHRDFDPAFRSYTAIMFHD